MASLLNYDILETPVVEPEDEKYSLWIKEGDFYSPAVNFEITHKLPPGLYKLQADNKGVFAKPTTLNTDELYLFSNNLISIVKKEVDKFWNSKDLYKSNKLTYKRGILLEGPPGCGKSALISLLIKDLIENDGLIFMINSIRDFTLYFDNFKSIITKIEPDRNIITIIEDVDKIINLSGGDNELLDLLDGRMTIENHLMILTSNDTSYLSPALLRPSRIDLRYEIKNPDESTRKEYFINKNIDESLIPELVKKTNNFSFAELKEVFIGVNILKKNIDDVITQIKNPKKSKNYLVKDCNIGL